MKKILPLLCLLLLPVLSFGQPSKLDSLQAALATAKDTIKVNLLLNISKSYISSDPAQAIVYANQAKELAAELGFPRGEAYALKNIGLAYYVQGKYGDVLQYWQQSLKIFVALQDQLGISNILNNIGSVYNNQGDDANALEYYLRSLKAAEKLGDKLRIASALSNIGLVYFNRKNNGKALEYYLEALLISRQIDDKEMIGICTINIGEVYVAEQKYDTALTYFAHSQEINEQTGNKHRVSYSLNSIGKIHAHNADYAKAIEYHKKALSTAMEVNAELEVAQALISLGHTYDKQGKISMAQESYSKARKIAQEIGANHELKDAYQGLALTYAKQSDFGNAYHYQGLLTGIKDTLYDTETSKKIVNLQANYENEKKQAQIDLLTKDKELQQLDLQNQKVIRNALLAGLALILVLAFVLFRNNQIKVKANRLLTLHNEQINQQKEEIASQRDNLEQTYNNLKNTQEQLIQSEKMASLGQLTAGVAHEINNPINFVSAGIDSLKDNYSDMAEVARQYFALNPEEDNKQKLLKLARLTKEVGVEELMKESEQLFRSIKNGANRTKEIVKSLRNFTRLDESDLKQAHLHEGIDSTLVILGSQLKDRIEVVKNYGDLEPINCYPGQLNQVFMNILNNAVQAIKGPGTIRIQTYKNGQYAVVKIKDSGVGMSEEVKKHIFEPFFTTKEVGEGTGLGLSITYGIIEKHHGKIEVESAPGQGTEFIIKLPLHLTASAEKTEAVSVVNY
jgi:signal transduction histidine kinase